jgi:hypothetical protein
MGNKRLQPKLNYRDNIPYKFQINFIEFVLKITAKLS